MKSPWENYEKNIFNKFNLPNEFGNIKVAAIALGFLLLCWASSGIYSVKEGEEAVVVRFGKFKSKSSPGLNYSLPAPIDHITIEKVNQSRRTEIGYRSTGNNVRMSYDSEEGENNIKIVPGESIMVTGDENILYLNCDVIWHIKDLANYIFNVVNPEETIKVAAESAMREIISQTPISSVLSNQKQQIADSIEALTQKILDQYGLGVQIDKVQLLKAEPPKEVIDFYRDVQTARADKEREVNQAQAYSNNILPKARGEAAEELQKAEGYKQEMIARAEGDAQRFSLIQGEYSKNKQITISRLSLEAAEEILGKSNNIVVIGNDNLLPHMPIVNKVNIKP